MSNKNKSEKRGRKAGGKNRNKVPKTSKLMKTCMQALDLHLENLYTILNSTTGDKEGQVTLKNKLDAGKEVRGIAGDVFGDELRAGAKLVVAQEGEENPYRSTLTPASIEVLEDEVDGELASTKEITESEEKAPVLSLIGRFEGS